MNIKIYNNLEVISDPFKAILLDAYGVFWGGNAFGPLPGSQDTMKRLVSNGKILGILSNTTQPAKKEIDKLKLSGFLEGIHFHFLITSGEVTKTIFLSNELPFPTPQKKFYVFGSAHPKLPSFKSMFEGTPFEETENISLADFIFIAIPHIQGIDQTDPTLFKEIIESILHSHLPMVCPNPDRFAHEGNPPRAVVRQGSIAQIYEEMGGKVFYIGKPSQIMYKTAMKNFSKYSISSPKEVLMVGDTPETDIRGANNYGMLSALILKTGIMADRIEKFGLDNVLNMLLKQDFPDFYIERMS